MTMTLGLLLAAGAGRRMGGPKALVEAADGTAWVVSSSRTLRDGGCEPVVVVLGAQAKAARGLLAGEDVAVVEAADWSEGMGASLRAGLRAVADDPADAVLVHLVDLPDVGDEVVRRMLAWSAPGVLARADYGHGPGHPVLIGRDHWAAVAGTAVGDRGARDHLATHDVLSIDCSDLASGFDVDRPPTDRPPVGRDSPMLGR